MVDQIPEEIIVKSCMCLLSYFTSERRKEKQKERG